MKIAIATDTYFPRINGVSTSTRVFARDFCNLGHKVDVHAPDFPNYSEEQELFEVFRYPSFYLAFDPEDRLAYGLRRQKKNFLAQKYDIVHTQTPFFLGWLAARWAKSKRIKVVHTCHTLYSAYIDYYLQFLPRKLKAISARQISKRYCDMCDLIIAPSPAMRDEVISYGTKCPAVVIPTGIDLSEFENPDPDSFRRKYNFSRDDKILLFVGRLAKEKNIDFLLRIFARVSKKNANAHFLIAGDGPARKELEAAVKIAQLSPRVRFLGYLKGDDLKDCYAAADLFLFASLTETQGLVITEAMSCGTPVVAIGKMGTIDIMSENRGGLLVGEDEDEFCKAVIEMLENNNLYSLKKKETFGEARKRSSLEIAKRVLNEYEKIIGG